MSDWRNKNLLHDKPTFYIETRMFRIWSTNPALERFGFNGIVRITIKLRKLKYKSLCQLFPKNKISKWNVTIKHWQPGYCHLLRQKYIDHKVKYRKIRLQDTLHPMKFGHSSADRYGTASSILTNLKYMKYHKTK